MKQICMGVILTFMFCGRAGAAQQSVRYQLPVVGQLTPQKALGVVAVSVAGYKLYHFAKQVHYQRRVHPLVQSFEDACINGKLAEATILAKLSPWLLSEPVDKYRRTCLHIFAAHNKADVVALLLKLGSTASTRDSFGKTAREYAQEQGHPAVVAEFEKHEINRQIFAAAINKNEQEVKTLLDRAFAVNMQDISEIRRAYNIAMEDTHNPAIIKLFVEAYERFEKERAQKKSAADTITS